MPTLGYLRLLQALCRKVLRRWRGAVVVAHAMRHKILLANSFRRAYVIIALRAMTGAWAIAQPATSYPEQYFIREETPAR